jgi:hypothetical protein
MGNSHKNYWANCNQTLVEWSLDNLLPKLCPVIPTSSQDCRQAKNRKRGWNLKEIFSETTEPISTKLCRNDPWVVSFHYCFRHFRPSGVQISGRPVAHGNQNVTWATWKRRKIAQLAIKNSSIPVSLNYRLSVCIVIVFLLTVQLKCF